MSTSNKRTPKLLSLLLVVCMVLSLLPIAALAAETDIPIDETNFPDTNFRTYVQEKFDKDGDSRLSEEEIADATKIDVHYKTVFSLEGIEHFSALETLNLNQTEVSELNLSKNAALKQLECEKTRLTTLDLSGNPNLEFLNCNNSRLTQLNVSKNSALKELYCGENQLTSLDLGESTGLLHLECYNNQLTQLDVSKNTALKELHCSDNKLTQLDLSNNTALLKITCHINKLTQMDVSKSVGLMELDFHGNLVPELNVSSNTALTKLDCSQNQLTQLDVSKNADLKNLYCSENQLTQLDVSKNTALEDLYCSENQLTSLDLSSNADLVFVSCSDNLYTVNQREDLDCATLPGKFDASNATNVAGGKFDAAKNTFSFDTDVTEATYDYATGNSKREFITFKLVYKAPEVPEPTEPKPTEPKPTEPKPTEPKPTEPKPTEPKPTEPKPTEPKPTEPKPTEPKPTEPKPTEPKPTEPKPTEPVENPFTDVSVNDYYYTPVLWAVENKITAGVAEGKFAPNQACTRAQIVTFLWATAGKPEPTSTNNPFTDVTESDYYYNAVLWAVEKGITSGMSADKFGPNVTSTRAQTVTFLWAAQGKPVMEHSSSFSDVASSDYYYYAVKWAVENKVTAGVGGDRFAPSQDCLRGQIVTFLYMTFA